MKRKLLLIVVTLLSILSIVGLVACAGEDSPGEDNQGGDDNQPELLEFENISFEFS